MKRVILLLAAVAAAAAASAQSSGRGWGGLLMDKDVLMPGDMVELSQTQFNFGTARAMAMAGAMVVAMVVAMAMAGAMALAGVYHPFMVWKYIEWTASPLSLRTFGEISPRGISFVMI